MERLDFSQRLEKATGYNPVMTCNFILPEDGNKTPNPTGDTYLNAYAGLLAGKNGFGITLPQDPRHISYLKKQGLIGNSDNNIIQVGQNGKREYPFGSPEAAFLALSAQEKNAIRAKIVNIQNAALFSNFVSDDTLDVARSLGIPHGNIALSEQENAKEISATSHSKSFLREKAGKYGYEIPLGRTIPQKGTIIEFDDFKKIILELQEEVKETYNLDNQGVEKVEYWLKFDSLSGGDGTINIKAPLTNEKIANALSQVKSIAQQCGMDLSNFPMPLVLEAGANSIPGKKISGNINIQGIIGDGDTLDKLRVSGQKTDENGNYLGNVLPFGSPDLQTAVNESFAKVCNAFRDIGYRGIIGGDAIVSQDANGSFHVEWFDLNPRINGSTPFQDQFDMFSREYPNLVGINFNLTFPQGVDFQEFREQMGRLLFDKKGSLGIIPVALRTNKFGKNPHPHASKNDIVKCTLLESSETNLNKTLQKIRSLGIKI